MSQAPWRLRPFRTLACVPLVAVLLVAPALTTGLAAQSTAVQEGPLQPDADVTRPHALTNDTIIKMSKAGLEDSVILQAIRSDAGRYDTSPEGLIALKNAGVSQRVIAGMQAHTSGFANRDGETGSPVNAGVNAPSPLAPGVDEIGVYYKDKTDNWTPLRAERVQFRSGGRLKSAATHNIVKQDENGFVDGPRSPLTLQTGVQILIYAPPGTQPEEYEWIRFREHSNGREFRVRTGGVFHTETGSQRDELEFHPERVGKGMYTFTVPVDIEKGQYGVLPPGSSNVPGISNAGKIFTFSIPE